jgi:hypothetical protein
MHLVSDDIDIVHGFNEFPGSGAQPGAGCSIEETMPTFDDNRLTFPNESLSAIINLN